MDLCVLLNKMAFENMTCKLTYVLNEPQLYAWEPVRGRRATDEEFKLIQVQARSTQAWQEAYGEVDNLVQI